MTNFAGCVVCDGVEDLNGRALMLVSALHHAADALAGVPIRFLNVVDRSVAGAIELLRWDLGLDAQTATSGLRAGEALAGARLYCAIVFKGRERLLEAQAASVGAPSLVAVQFPDASDLDAARLCLLSSAHDPVLFAAQLGKRLGR